MSDRETGGPAFPCPQDSINQNVPSLGITVRDYFAAKAMQAYFTDPDVALSKDNFEFAAIASYRIADAMLEARKE